MMIVVMGVTGSGKTAVGECLARKLQWLFVDADDYHSAGNKQKMAAGIPLTDEDRAPWLERLHNLLEDWDESGINGVLACSALRGAYRDVLSADIAAGNVRFVWLDVPKALLEEHLAEREHAFMNPALLDSQLATLETPADALRVPALDAQGNALSIDQEVDAIVSGLNLSPAQD